ncbi:MAG: DUF2500 domain-containing protein [Clostridia bacterium]|nr:DUF2500 domain-containing protein [Clostridia bacterium]
MTDFLYTRGFSGFDTFGLLLAIIVAGVFIVVIVKGLSQWTQNNNSPELTENATVVAKRTEVRGHDRPITYYYVTFQLENGDRLEFPVKGSEYGMLCESDHGRLSHQGTRYHGFERD